MATASQTCLCVHACVCVCVRVCVCACAVASVVTINRLPLKYPECTQLKHTADFHKLNIYPVLLLFQRAVTLPLRSALLCITERRVSCRATSAAKVHSSRALQSGTSPAPLLNVGQEIGRHRQQMCDRSKSVITSTVKGKLRHYVIISGALINRESE